MARSQGLEITRRVIIHAPAARVLAAFFNPADLAEWWQVARSVTVPRPLGTYAVEWAATEHRDAQLGRLGGAFHGTVIDVTEGVEFFIADAFWHPPEGDPIGPMALDVRCLPTGDPRETALTIRQSAEDEGPRWQRYFAVVGAGWDRALADLRRYLEEEALRSPR